MPSWLQAYVGLEAAASSIRAFRFQFIPGLLQTEEYAAAVVRLRCPAEPADEIDLRVRTRMARQDLLTGPRAPHLWAVLDEAALRRPAGRPGVMRRQLQHLLEAAARPNITVQVIPFQAGGYPAAGGPFTILRFAEADLPDVVYLEQLAGALYLDERDTVVQYLEVMDRLCAAAAPPAVTVKVLNEILRDR